MSLLCNRYLSKWRQNIVGIKQYQSNKIVSSSYVVFRSKDTDKLLPEYLFLMLNALNLTAILDSILGGVQEKHLTGRKWNVYKFRYRLSKCSKQSLMSIIVWKTPNK